MPEMIWPVLGLLMIALAIALPLTGLLTRLGHRLDTLDTPGAAGHDKELRRVPNIGGVAIYIAIALPMALALMALQTLDVGFWQERVPEIVPHLGRLERSAPTALALLVCLTVLHITGLVDDRRGLGPLIKLFVQAAAATTLVVWFDVRLLTLLGPGPSIVLTVLWIVVITNALNFLDNMDGLAAGVAAIAAALFLAATLVNHQWFIAGSLALLVGALAGFLVFNFPPAKIFMGDGGSLVIGFLLGVLTARTTFVDPAAPAFPLGSASYGALMPVVVLAVPLYDLVTVTLIRLRQGRSPFVGDQQHFSHRLVDRGLSRRGAVIVIWSATAVTGVGGIGLGRLAGWQALLVGVQTIAVLLMLALLEHASRRRAERDDDR